MFDRRDDIVKFLAVAEAGKIDAAAERLAIAQPALTRTIARLEARFGARLFERLPTGVRLTPLGETAVELARGLLREIDAAAEKFDAMTRGRTGRYRITASSMWMEAVLAPAVDAFSARLPGIELTFVETPRFTGALYKASGWTLVGTTKGRGRYDRHTRRDQPKKDIWLRPLRKDWRRTLNR